MLYNKRSSPYFVEPVVVGLERIPTTSSEKEEENDNVGYGYAPFLSSYDVIGASSTSKAFVCAGVASESLYGTAEAAWKPNLPSDQLAQVCGKAFLSALERDCLSGYGATVYLLTPDRVVEIDLDCRND